MSQNLQNLIEAATQNDVARAAAQQTMRDPTQTLALVVVGLVVVFAAFAGAAVFAKRSH